jgi:uncharacterized protein (TIGR02246 family)
MLMIDRGNVCALANAYAEAWSARSPEAVASFFAPDGQISINRSEPTKGRDAIAQMAAGFYAELPNMIVRCDGVRASGSHALLLWTFEGHHARTHNFVRVVGWEEWEFNEAMKIESSLGWYDAADYDRQIRGG